MKSALAMILAALIALLGTYLPVTVQQTGPVFEGPFVINEDEDMPVLLVNYCKKTVATVGGDGYSEVVLYQTADNTYEIHYYSKYEYDEAERHTAYSADSGIIKDVYSVIRRNNFDSWNNGRYPGGLCGAVYILKYRNEDGTYTRVTSDNMPDNGENLMYEVAACLARYVHEENKLPVEE